jgi:hypothetical protein
MSEESYGAFAQELHREFPRFVLVDKSQSPSQKVIDVLLRIVTLGQNRHYLSHVITTFGQRVYVPPTWEAMDPVDRIIILRHEAVHIRQYKRFTWPGMMLLYLFLPLPLFFAGGRAFIELEAYKETLTATWELRGPEAARATSLRDQIVQRFTGSDYGWMWVHGRMIRRALQRHLESLEVSRESTGLGPKP